MINIRDLTYRVAGRRLFDAANATIPAGHHVGLVGRNGTGKTTLLRLISGEIQYDDGAIEISGVKGLAHPLGMVAQEAAAGPESALDAVLAADHERAALMVEAETATEPNRIAEIQMRLVDIEAHSAPARAASILAGLGFDQEMQAGSMASLSGGWRMRVALASVLFIQPEVLLLDEPTNHLDFESAVWLEGYLRAYPKTLLIVSHDRGLLNRAVNSILSLEGEKLTLYGGGYDRFEAVRAEHRALREAERGKQDVQRKHMQAFIDRFRYKASKARQAQSRIKALERMGTLPDAIAEPHTVLSFPEPDELAPPLIATHSAAVGYDADTPVLRGLDLRLDGDDRIGLLGQNGNGKTTLARLIANRLPTMGGEMHRSAKLRVGFFAQHQVEELDPDADASTHMARLMPDAPPDRVRARLGGVGLVQNKQITKVKHLSGGEKARLTLALITYDRPHVLVLDEPTNHLDIDARDALVAALNDYKGAVILVSHDRRLLELVVDRLWLVADGTVRSFDGDLDDYSKWVRDQRRGDRSGKAVAPPPDLEPRETGAERRKRMAPLRRQVQEAEKAMGKLERERAALVKTLSDPKTYNASSTQQIQKMGVKKVELDKQIAAAEAAWMEASEALETAE